MAVAYTRVQKGSPTNRMRPRRSLGVDRPVCLHFDDPLWPRVNHVARMLERQPVCSYHYHLLAFNRLWPENVDASCVGQKSGWKAMTISPQDEDLNGQQHWNPQMLQSAAFALSSCFNSVKKTLIEGSIVLTSQHPMH